MIQVIANNAYIGKCTGQAGYQQPLMLVYIALVAANKTRAHHRLSIIQIIVQRDWRHAIITQQSISAIISRHLKQVQYQTIAMTTTVLPVRIIELD